MGHSLFLHNVWDVFCFFFLLVAVCSSPFPNTWSGPNFCKIYVASWAQLRWSFIYISLFQKVNHTSVVICLHSVFFLFCLPICCTNYLGFMLGCIISLFPLCLFYIPYTQLLRKINTALQTELLSSVAQFILPFSIRHCVFWKGAFWLILSRISTLKYKAMSTLTYFLCIYCILAYTYELKMILAHITNDKKQIYFVFDTLTISKHDEYMWSHKKRKHMLMPKTLVLLVLWFWQKLPNAPFCMCKHLFYSPEPLLYVVCQLFIKNELHNSQFTVKYCWNSENTLADLWPL